MSGKKRRLSRHDDRPGSALTLWYLWQLVPATEDVDGEDDRFTDQMWSYYVHQIAREHEQPGAAPNLGGRLGPLDVDDHQEPS